MRPRALHKGPVAGRLGEVATLQVGMWVARARLGAVVPPGTLKVMADSYRRPSHRAEPGR